MRKFWFLFFAILLFGFISRIYAVRSGNLFFTVDEGRDAVYARQIINYHEIFTKGPQATLKGLYSGPLWYYFVAAGYTVFKGNPVGVVYALILLNLTVVAVLMIMIKKEVNEKLALITGFGLMISWQFFTTSLWGFNPFALPALAIILVLLLVKNKYGLGVILVVLAFNAELAGAIALFVFYITAGFFMTLYKKINWKTYLIFAFAMPLLAVAKILIDFLRTPRDLALHAVTRISGTNFIQMAIEFFKLGAGIFLIIFIIYLFKKNKNSFICLFVYLNICLLFTNYMFFGSTHGWTDWQTAFIPPLILISILLMVWEIKRFRYLIIGSIFVLQFINFRTNYLNYLKPSPDPSLLYNQEKVIDWIYTHNENNGFNLYVYTNTYFDYSYQYLISWYGKIKYGFYPCEYSNFPLSIKALYIPHPENYVSPQLGCDKFRFLIIDSTTNGNENKDWINDFRSQTIFLESTKIGDTIIEKRRVPDKIR